MANIQVGLCKANSNWESGLWRGSGSFDPVWRICALLMTDVVTRSGTGKGKPNAQGKGRET
jgi:hypothetical protein